MQGIRTVLFDLDGTLVDSAPDMAVAVDRMLAELGRPPAGVERVRRWVGNGARRLVMRALTGDMDGAPPDDETERALAAFLAYYGERLSVDSRVYPGVVDGLDRLRADGYGLACVTNKPEALARALLDATGLGRYLPVVVGGDTLPERKPEAAPLHYAMAALGGRPERTLMVGDSRADVDAGRNAGTGVVCVPYGYNGGEDVRAMGPDAVVGSIEELHDRLSTSVVPHG
ncbi:phosphoglycolate phosphatase [Aquisalimonas lutea]|nr:phosphoglycolate phosphatase [Aquisalimonas lutea]MDN3516144.1 phosphoglycolate phosphatase [Aquisalimonas lutea]